MSNKDNIKDLFSERFQNFEAEVDANAWGNIQKGIQITPAKIAETQSFWSAASIGVAVISGIIISVAGIVWVNTSSEGSIDGSPAVTQTVETKAPIKEVAEPNDQENIQTQLVAIELKETISNTSPQIEVSKDTDQLNVEAETKSVSAVSEKELETQVSVVNNQNNSKQDLTNVISKAPESIVIKEQSRVVASPMGGNAPLTVSFTSMARVNKIKWKFDDGEESEELTPEHVYEKPGIYFVTMLAELADGTVTMDKAVVEVKEPIQKPNSNLKPSHIFVPNVFTPNGDGENDKLIVTVEEVESFTISIYSVNGKLVYNSEDPYMYWNGTDLTGNMLEDGVYYYLVNAIGLDGKVYAPKGYISLRTKN